MLVLPENAYVVIVPALKNAPDAFKHLSNAYKGIVLESIPKLPERQNDHAMLPRAMKNAGPFVPSLSPP